MNNNLLNKLTTREQRHGTWGTIFDLKNITDWNYLKHIPSRFVGKSFEESNHSDIENWERMSDFDKWQMGYWIEFQTGKRSARLGFIAGIIVCVFLFLILNSL